MVSALLVAGSIVVAYMLIVYAMLSIDGDCHG